MPFGREPGRSSGPAMLKPKAAKRPAASKPPPTLTKQPASFQPQRAVVVIDSSSEVDGEEELEVGDGRGTADEQGQLMENNMVKGIWGTGLLFRWRTRKTVRPSDAWFRKHGLPTFQELLELALDVGARALYQPTVELVQHAFVRFLIGAVYAVGRGVSFGTGGFRCCHCSSGFRSGAWAL